MWVRVYMYTHTTLNAPVYYDIINITHYLRAY